MLINNILFDFDGVILNSNKIKEDAFKFIFRNEDNYTVLKFIEYHRENGSVSRFYKIRFFYNELLNQKIDDNNFKNLLNEFSKYTIDKLSRKDLILNQTIEFIKRNKNYNYHIVSGSFERDLITI